jgi:tetratricopeptide (TPR) repeat protein
MTGPGRLLPAVALAIAASGALVQAADRDAAAKNNEGNRLYEGRQYDEALKLYTDAQARLPNSPELHYNIGNVLFRKAEFDKAVEEYRKAEASPDPVLAQRATYNRGNALLLQQRPQEAVQAYVQALRARPDDAEAKRNLELALRMMQEQQKQQDQPQDRDQDKQDDQQPPRPSEADPQDRKPPQQTPPRPKPGQMSEAEARRLLEALREEEREGLRKQARAAVLDRRDPEKDW